MALSITFILILGSWFRTGNEIQKIESIHEWMTEFPISLTKNSIPFEIPLCSMSGRKLILWESMTFTVDFYNGTWEEGHRGVFALTKTGLDFMWHNKQNFMEEDLPLPDKGRHWRSSSSEFFVYYFGNFYSNLYCRNFKILNK